MDPPNPYPLVWVQFECGVGLDPWRQAGWIRPDHLWGGAPTSPCPIFPFATFPSLLRSRLRSRNLVSLDSDDPNCSPLPRSPWILPPAVQNLGIQLDPCRRILPFIRTSSPNPSLAIHPPPWSSGELILPQLSLSDSSTFYYLSSVLRPTSENAVLLPVFSKGARPLPDTLVWALPFD